MALRRRAIRIAGHRTSVSVEDPFWAELRRIAREDGLSVARVVEEIDAGRGTVTGEEPPNLSSAIRLYVLERLRREAGHGSAG